MTGATGDGIYLARAIVGGLACQGPLPCALRDPVACDMGNGEALASAEMGMRAALRGVPDASRTPGPSATLATPLAGFAL